MRTYFLQKTLLPEDIIIEIISKFNLIDLISCSKLCKSFYLLIKKLHLSKNIFLEIKPTETTPTSRLWCSSVMLKGLFYIYGGHLCTEQTNTISEIKNDLQEFDFKTKQWRQLSHKMAGLTEHKCVSYDDHLWFLGGHNGQDYCNSVYKYDTINQITTEIEKKGKIFSPRSAFTVCVYGQKMYVFGGWNGFLKVWHNDIHEWKQIIPKGKIPTQRTSHCGVGYKNCMYIFGGFS